MTLKTNEILNKFKNNELTLEQAQKLLDQPLDYATIDYDENGNISLEGNQTSDWEGAFYNTSFDQLFKNN